MLSGAAAGVNGDLALPERDTGRRMPFSVPKAALGAIGEPARAGLTVFHRSTTLTIFAATWTPQMNLMPHNHLMWALFNWPALLAGATEGGEPRQVPGSKVGDLPIQVDDDQSHLFVSRGGEVQGGIFRVNLTTGRRELWRETMTLPDPQAQRELPMRYNRGLVLAREVTPAWS